MATFLCLASYFKGEDFIKQLKADGNTVFLVTSKILENKPWPVDSIDEIFYIQENEKLNWNLDHLIMGTAALLVKHEIDAVVALDDFDIAMAASLREAFRINGMGLTTARYFRDKLAMRTRGLQMGIKVPAFSPLFNDDIVNSFLSENQAPWLIKPRGEASVVGIEICHNPEEVWNVINALGNERHNYLIEAFITGQVYHVDSLSFDKKAIFTQVSKYLETPMKVAHEGGIFRTKTLAEKDLHTKKLKLINQELLEAFGMRYSASHAEFIYKEEEDAFYFVEIASRVGGAHISEMIEAASGINMWAEWARIEDHAIKNINYSLPSLKKLQAGLIISLSKQSDPDYSFINPSEVVWTLKKEHHIGIIIVDKNVQVVDNLIEKYTTIIENDYFTSAPKSNSHSL